jgi:ubiquinone biosynthesis protein COQ9
MNDDDDDAIPASDEPPTAKLRRSRRKAADARSEAAGPDTVAPETASARTGGDEAPAGDMGPNDPGPDNDSAGAGAADDTADSADDRHLALQRTILDAALPHACIDGWTREMLARAAVEAGLAEAEAEQAFPRGGIDAVLAYVRFVDDDMVAELEDLERTEPSVYANMRTREKIAIAMQVRLESQTANRDAVRKGLRLLADPRHAPDAAKSLARTVDAIWRIAGDTSTDFNWYTKRGLLAGVYSATLLYWLNDSSEDQRKTWEFMRARIADVLRIGQATAGFAKVAERLPNPFGLCGAAKRRWRDGPVFR